MDSLFRADRPIALVGLMGAGKSSIGRRLAARLGLPFADSDDEIERAAGLDVAGIFARDGEPAFRDLERRVIRRLASGPPRVIATGGGAFIDEETRTLLRARCLTIWLDADLDTLASRVRSGDARRPLLDGRDPRAALAELATERNPAYAEARLRVTSGPRPPEETVGEILDRLNALEQRRDRDPGLCD